MAKEAGDRRKADGYAGLSFTELVESAGRPRDNARPAVAAWGGGAPLATAWGSGRSPV